MFVFRMTINIELLDVLECSIVILNYLILLASSVKETYTTKNKLPE